MRGVVDGDLSHEHASVLAHGETAAHQLFRQVGSGVAHQRLKTRTCGWNHKDQDSHRHSGTPCDTRSTCTPARLVRAERSFCRDGSKFRPHLRDGQMPRACTSRPEPTMTWRGVTERLKTTLQLGTHRHGPQNAVSVVTEQIEMPGKHMGCQIGDGQPIGTQRAFLRCHLVGAPHFWLEWRALSRQPPTENGGKNLKSRSSKALYTSAGYCSNASLDRIFIAITDHEHNSGFHNPLYNS